jgi:hypothetical protein
MRHDAPAFLLPLDAADDDVQGGGNAKPRSEATPEARLVAMGDPLISTRTTEGSTTPCGTVCGGRAFELNATAQGVSIYRAVLSAGIRPDEAYKVEMWYTDGSGAASPTSDPSIEVKVGAGGMPGPTTLDAPTRRVTIHQGCARDAHVGDATDPVCEHSACVVVQWFAMDYVKSHRIDSAAGVLPAADVTEDLARRSKARDATHYIVRVREELPLQSIPHRAKMVMDGFDSILPFRLFSLAAGLGFGAGQATAGAFMSTEREIIVSRDDLLRRGIKRTTLDQGGKVQWATPVSPGRNVTAFVRAVNPAGVGEWSQAGCEEKNSCCTTCSREKPTTPDDGNDAAAVAAAEKEAAAKGREGESQGWSARQGGVLTMPKGVKPPLLPPVAVQVTQPVVGSVFDPIGRESFAVRPTEDGCQQRGASSDTQSHTCQQCEGTCVLVSWDPPNSLSSCGAGQITAYKIRWKYRTHTISSKARNMYDAMSREMGASTGIYDALQNARKSATRSIVAMGTASMAANFMSREALVHRPLGQEWGKLQRRFLIKKVLPGHWLEVSIAAINTAGEGPASSWSLASCSSTYMALAPSVVLKRRQQGAGKTAGGASMAVPTEANATKRTKLKSHAECYESQSPEATVAAGKTETDAWTIKPVEEGLPPPPVVYNVEMWQPRAREVLKAGTIVANPSEGFSSTCVDNMECQCQGGTSDRPDSEPPVCRDPRAVCLEGRCVYSNSPVLTPQECKGTCLQICWTIDDETAARTGNMSLHSVTSYTVSFNLKKGTREVEGRVCVRPTCSTRRHVVVVHVVVVADVTS